MQLAETPKANERGFTDSQARLAEQPVSELKGCGFQPCKRTEMPGSVTRQRPARLTSQLPVAREIYPSQTEE